MDHAVSKLEDFIPRRCGVQCAACFVDRYVASSPPAREQYGGRERSSWTIALFGARVKSLVSLQKREREFERKGDECHTSRNTKFGKSLLLATCDTYRSIFLILNSTPLLVTGVVDKRTALSGKLVRHRGCVFCAGSTLCRACLRSLAS